MSSQTKPILYWECLLHATTQKSSVLSIYKWLFKLDSASIPSIAIFNQQGIAGQREQVRLAFSCVQGFLKLGFANFIALVEPVNFVKSLQLIRAYVRIRIDAIMSRFMTRFRNMSFQSLEMWILKKCKSGCVNFRSFEQWKPKFKVIE